MFQIDNLRKDGRFIGTDGTIPEGQGIIHANLNECHDLVEMVCVSTRLESYMWLSVSSVQLKQSMDEEETADEDDDYDYSDGD